MSSARKVEDGKASTAMALVAAADYLVAFRPGREPVCPSWREQLSDFLAQKELLVTKKTKRSENGRYPSIYLPHGAFGGWNIYAACLCQLQLYEARACNGHLPSFSRRRSSALCIYD